MPPSRRPRTHQSHTRYLPQPVLLVQVPPTLYIPDDVASAVMGPRYHPYALEYANRCTFMRTVRAGEDVDWDNLVMLEVDIAAPGDRRRLLDLLNIADRERRARHLHTLAIELAVSRRLRAR